MKQDMQQLDFNLFKQLLIKLLNWYFLLKKIKSNQYI